MTNRTNRRMLLTALRRGLADFAYGIDAGNAIRHGLPVPPRRVARAGDALPMAAAPAPCPSNRADPAGCGRTAVPI